VKGARESGHAVSHAHLRHLNPLPADLGDLLRRFRRVLLPELNLGQLSMLLRARYLIDIESFTKVAGQPFKVFELQEKIEQMLQETS
jgi:2-oxoglutarate ferredoxin oxidoreductase subunit alpha